MRSRGLVGLVAIVMAAVATLAIYLYVQGVRENVATGGGNTSVIVAQHDIPAGSDLNELIEQGAFAEETVKNDLLVAGAVTSVEELQNQKTISPILEGEQVSTARLQGTSSLPGGTLGIPKGHQAMTLPLDSPRIVAGKIQPGDNVAIWGSFEPEEDAGVEGDTTILTVPEAKVLALSGNAGQGQQSLVTLALKPEDVARVVYSQEKGTVWMSLLPPGESGKEVGPTFLVKVLNRSNVEFP